MVHVTIVKVGEVNTTRECFDAEVLIRSRWREPQLDNTTQVMLMLLLLLLLLMMMILMMMATVCHACVCAYYEQAY